MLDRKYFNISPVFTVPSKMITNVLTIQTHNQKGSAQNKGEKNWGMKIQ